jgi:predicted RNA-binding Zn ribbon-like protein
VRRFCNSINRENGADRFADAAGVDRWLASEGHAPLRAKAEDLARVIAFREALHAITLGGPEPRTADAWTALADVVARVTLGIQAHGDRLQIAVTSSSPTDVFLGELALICLHAHRSGELQRLKSCVNCEWTFYDTSKNQSGRWCSMTACGGRHNARAYRRRRHRDT